MLLPIFRSHRPFRLLAIFLAAILALGSIVVPALAQERGVPTLRVTKIATEGFPMVKVYVLGQNLGVDLATLDIALKQDGIDYPATSEMAAMGTQTAIVLDASENIRKPGLTGDAKYVEVGNIITRLIARGELEVQGDWLAAFAPDKNNQLLTIKDWTRDHQGLANEIYLFQPISGIGNTPLFNLIYNALGQYEQADIDPALQRSMVVFSDGVDVVSGLQLDDVVSLAKEKGVTINTVMLGKSTPQTRSNLERIALRTGGQYRELASLDALDALWDQVVAGRDQKVLSYRSQAPAPREVILTAALPGGRKAEVRQAFPAINVAPVQVQITQPARGTPVVRSSATYETPLAELEPKVLPITLNFLWPNERPRQLRRVEYTINDDTRIVEQEPFDQYIFPIEGLGAGNYTLRVKAVDELGVEGQSEPIPFTVQIDQPPAPTATPFIGPPPPPTSPPWISYAALAIGLLSLLIALIVFFRKPERRERAADFVTGAVKSITEPFFLDRKKGGQPEEVKARLVVIEGDAAIPSPIPIRGPKTLIGRDPSVSNLVLPDARVSRYHCRIAEEADGSFKIYDEGSTSGTYVNYEPVGMRGQVLRSDDVINVGPIALRFELLADRTVPYQPAMGSAAPSDSAPDYEDDADDLDDDDPDRTKPFQMQSPKRP